MKKKNLLLTFLLAALAFGGGNLMAQTSVYETDFESMNTYTAPTNWTNMGGIIQVQSNNAINGSKSARFGGNTNTSIVAMPSISNINTLQITFSQRSDTNAGTLEVGYVTNTSDASTFNTISSYSASDYTTASTVTVSLSTASSGAYIAFRHTTATTYKYWYIDDVIVETAASCSIPTSLSCVTTSSTTANITWTAGGNETAWQFYYSSYDYATPYNAASGDIITVNTTPSYTITGLNPNTEYFVYVRAKCGDDDYSDWTDAVSFTTFNPQSLPINYGFEDGGTALANWTMLDANANTGAFNSEAYGGSSYCFRFYSTYQGITQYLITPELSGTSNGVNVQFYRKQTSAGAWIQVGYSTETNSTEDFTWSDATPNAATVNKDYVSFELSCPTGTKFVAIKNTATTGTWVYIDNITITVPSRAITDGNWNSAAIWATGAVPSNSANVIISSNVTIPNGYTATANNITIDGGSLTIEDGAQLVCNNNPAVTMVKHIDAADWNDNTSGWNFIATPITAVTIDNTAHTNLIGGTAEYDLYRFNQSAVSQWQNYKQNHFTTLENGTGYLYARNASIDVLFMGELAIPSGEINLAYDETADPNMIGWNLVGNPFPCNATVDQSFYVIDGGTIKASTAAAVAPCSGVMVRATAATRKVTFTKAPNASVLATAKSNINMTLTNANSRTAETLDNAIISLNEGSELGKFYFGTQDANIYIPQDGNDYAIVSAEAQGEVPVSFKANQDGQYTISVNVEDVEMNYLHLVDNLTGANIDLLTNPSYTFSANVNDYTSRFRLVFSANDIDENAENEDFAYVSNGQIIVNNAEQATVDIIDMMGRTIARHKGENVIPTTGMSKGIYIIRMTDGMNVRNQRIIIK